MGNSGKKQKALGDLPYYLHTSLHILLSTSAGVRTFQILPTSPQKISQQLQIWLGLAKESQVRWCHALTISYMTCMFPFIGQKKVACFERGNSQEFTFSNCPA